LTRQLEYIYKVERIFYSSNPSAKNYNQASQLIDKITSPKLFKAYGQAMEEQKKYVEAEKAYSAAKDVDGVIRMNLNFLQNPEKAFELVRQTRSQEGARLVAKFCQTKIGDIRAAIEFLLMAKLPEEAFAEAQVTSSSLKNLSIEETWGDG
jgi:WD repeat-containing protein 19